MTAGPLISVIVPAFNAADYIEQTLQSILNQVGPSFETIVVDDGSTDATAEIVARFGSLVRYQRIDHFGGPARPRNVGASLSNAEWLSVFDSDDIMHPGRLARFYEVAILHADAALICSNFQSIDESGAVTNGDFLADYQSFRNVCKQTELPKVFELVGPMLLHELARANFIGTSSVLLRRTALASAGGFDESLYNADDIALWYCLAGRGDKFVYIDEVHHSYRKRRNSVSSRGTEKYASILKALRDQRQVIESPATLALLDRKIRNARFDWAGALRASGNSAGALKIYAEELIRHPSWPAMRGIGICAMTMFLPGRKP